jgi:hypothetical protein
MSNAKIDLTGKKFGRLTVLRYAGRTSHRQALWRCKCVCGNESDVRRSNLITGKAKSCGCLSAEKARKRWIFKNKANPSTHLSSRYEGGAIEDLEDLIR